jgi:hypothetical protein
LRNGRRSSEPTVRFVVNRLAGKFRYDDLEQICYAAQLRELSRPDEFGRFSHDSSVLCYIPTDSIVSESFGEYPFQIEIAPNVVFSRKVALMLWSLLRDAREPFDDDIKPLARMNKTGYREKVRRTVISAEERYTRWIIGGFAWWSTAFVFAGALVLAAMLINFVAGQTIEHLIHSLRPFRRIGITFGILACIAMLIYGGKVFFSLAGYYAARHSFQRRLLRLLGRPPSAWQRLSLFRLLLLRIGTLVVACLLSIYLFLAVVAVLMVGVRALISI